MSHPTTKVGLLENISNSPTFKELGDVSQDHARNHFVSENASATNFAVSRSYFFNENYLTSQFRSITPRARTYMLITDSSRSVAKSMNELGSRRRPP